jgi:hypothetical protein
MKLLKKISCIAFLAISSFYLTPSQGLAQSMAGPEGGCSITVMGTENPSTKVWCSVTMSMSACNSGGSTTSQTCSSYASCGFNGLEKSNP